MIRVSVYLNLNEVDILLESLICRPNLSNNNAFVEWLALQGKLNHIKDELANMKEVEFWITSSRGTNQNAIISVPKDADKEDMKYRLEQWCSQFGAWSHGENYLRYGWNEPENYGVRD